MNCAVMALMFYQPWTSVDELGRTWDNPFSQNDWLKTFKKKLGFGPGYNGKGVVGLAPSICAQFLNELDLSVDRFSHMHLGDKMVQSYMHNLHWYAEAPFLLIASVQYNHLPGDHPVGAHAVVVVDITETEIVYHDPGMQYGAQQRCSHKEFDHAMRMLELCGGSKFFGSYNLMAIWDHDRVPDLQQTLRKMAVKKSVRSKPAVANQYEASKFVVYNDPLKFLKKLEKSGKKTNNP